MLVKYRYDLLSLFFISIITVNASSLRISCEIDCPDDQPQFSTINSEINLLDMPQEIVKIILDYISNSQIHHVSKSIFNTIFNNTNIMNNGLSHISLSSTSLLSWNITLNYNNVNLQIDRMPTYFLQHMVSEIIDLPTVNIYLITNTQIKCLSYVDYRLLKEELPLFQAALQNSNIKEIRINNQFFELDAYMANHIINHSYMINWLYDIDQHINTICYGTFNPKKRRFSYTDTFTEWVQNMRVTKVRKISLPSDPFDSESQQTLKRRGGSFDFDFNGGNIPPAT